MARKHQCSVSIHRLCVEYGQNGAPRGRGPPFGVTLAAATCVVSDSFVERSMDSEVLAMPWRDIRFNPLRLLL